MHTFIFIPPIAWFFSVSFCVVFLLSKNKMEKAVIFRIHEFQDRRVLTMDGLVCTSK